jgi:hypothetical protein
MMNRTPLPFLRVIQSVPVAAGLCVVIHRPRMG